MFLIAHKKATKQHRRTMDIARLIDHVNAGTNPLQHKDRENEQFSLSIARAIIYRHGNTSPSMKSNLSDSSFQFVKSRPAALTLLKINIIPHDKF
jgi:hypothetical protein